MTDTVFRLQILSNHLKFTSLLPDSNSQVVVSQQTCAAHQTLLYARPAAPDARFACPARHPPPSAELEALGVAKAVLSKTMHPFTTARPPSPPLPSAALPPSPPPPLYARPASDFSIFLPQEKETAIALLSSSFQKAGTASLPPLLSQSGHFAPHVTVQESEFGYLLQAALAGVKAGDVRIELLSGDRLVVTGVRRADRADNRLLPELLVPLQEVFGLPRGGKPKLLHGEMPLPSGRFRLVWPLPKDANPESLRAEVKDGCLLVSLTKRDVLTLL